MILMSIALILAFADLAMSLESASITRISIDILLIILILIDLLLKREYWLAHHNEQYVKKDWWKNE